VAVGVP